MSAATEVKRNEVKQLHQRGLDIIEKHKGMLPADKVNELRAIKTAINAKKAEIETEEAAEHEAAEFKTVGDWLDKPLRKVPHGVNGDDDDRKSLERAGWEFKGGLAYAPSSLGKTVEMFGENVILGDIDTENQEFARFQKTTRHAMSIEYKTAYSKFWREMARSGGEFSMAMQKMSPAEQKALAEGQDTTGGFLVPPDTQAEMLARTAQKAVMRGLARIQTTNSDTLKWPMMTPNTTSGSIYSSGFVGSWAGETPVFTETDPGFQTFGIPIKKLRVATKVANDLIMDAAFNVLSLLATDGSQNMALVEDNGFLLGDGAALQPLGLFNGGFTTFDVEGTTTDQITNTTASAGSAPKIIAGIYLIPDQYVDGSVFLTSRTNEGKIAALVDANGRPFWALNAGSGFAAPPRSIEGLPIKNSSFVASGGTDGNKVCFVGNVAQAYIIGQRAQITTTVLRERFADTDQTGIIIWERAGGAVWNTDAGRVGIV